MVNTFRYKCIQSPESGQPVYIRFLTPRGRPATFTGMRKRILLPLLVMLLLCATLATYFLLFGHIVCLVDATYYRTVYRANERTLKRQLLLSGYRLSSVEVVPSKLDDSLLAGLAEKHKTSTLYVVLSPLLTELVEKHKLTGLENMHLIGIGDAHPDESRFFSYLIPNQSFDWQEAQKELGARGSALVLTSEGRQQHAFDSSRTVVQQEGETDQAFSKRLETLGKQQGLLTIFAPELGPWAMDLLSTSALSWVIDATYLPLVEREYLQGIVADDLAHGILSALRGDKDTVQLTKRCFTEREIGGS